MSGEEKNAGGQGAGTAAASLPSEQPYIDEHTTEPNAPQQAQQAVAAKPVQEKWQMPKPKFQQSSGYLPQGYLKDIKMTGDGVAGGPPDDEAEQLTAERITGIEPEGVAPQTAPAIEPQPDLSEQLLPDEPVVAANEPAIQQRSSSGLPVILLGIVGVLLFLAVFLAAVYYFFLAKPAGGNNF